VSLRVAIAIGAAAMLVALTVALLSALSHERSPVRRDRVRSPS